MNKLKTIAVLTMSMAALSTAFAAEQAVTESALAAPVVQPQAGNVELDRIVAVVNNDGITDVVFTFKAKDVTKGAVAGAAMDLWLYTQINGHRVTGFDVVPVENDKVKMHKGARDGKGLL